MKNKIIRYAGIASLAASLLFGSVSAAKAASLNAEVIGGNKETTLDLKLGGEIVPKINFFCRNLTTVDYDNNTTPLLMTNLIYNINNNLDVFARGFIAPNGITPRLGTQYHNKFGDFSFYGSGTIDAQEDPSLEFQIILGYTPRLTENLNLYLNAEEIVNFNRENHNFNIQRLRAGLEIARYRFGIGANLKEAGDDFNFTYNIGGFVGKMF